MSTTIESAWGTITATGPAHRFMPAGGDQAWRTSCGRILRTVPNAASSDARQCGRCVEQVNGSQRNRPLINGRNSR